MNWWQSIVLGVVEGLTEFLPVSSTGHLLLAQRAMGIPASEAATAYAICIQAGAIVAVLGVYLRRLRQMAQGVLGMHPEGRRLSGLTLLAFVPAAVIGKTFDKRIEALLFGLWPVVAAWLVGGLAILLVTAIHRRRTASLDAGIGLDGLTPRMALFIGLSQCLAMWPGTSRSLVTIVAGLLMGLSMSAAVEFSFLLGLITLGAASGYKLVKSGGVMIAAYGPGQLALGFIVAAVSAFAAVRWMVNWLRRHDLSVFGWYRVALALVVASLLAMNMLAP